MYTKRLGTDAPIGLLLQVGSTNMVEACAEVRTEGRDAAMVSRKPCRPRRQYDRGLWPPCGVNTREVPQNARPPGGKVAWPLSIVYARAKTLRRSFCENLRPVGGRNKNAGVRGRAPLQLSTVAVIHVILQAQLAVGARFRVCIYVSCLRRIRSYIQVSHPLIYERYTKYV